MGELEDIKGQINMLSDDEAIALDALPESLKYSERGDAMQEAIDNLDEAASLVGDASKCLEDAAK